MDIIISNASEKPIYDQIYSQVKSAIMKGVLKEGDALPSIRALARDLKISVITTKRAFDDLERDGFIHSVQGKGSFVAPSNPQMLKEEILREIEASLSKAYELSRACGVSKAELAEMLRVVAEEV
jgi:transcriptional regulator, gntR family